MLKSLETNKENAFLPQLGGPAAKHSNGADLQGPRGKSPKIRQSTSLLSLRALTGRRNSSGDCERPIVISQPTLDPSSHEKVRNKLKHSPSMMSINAYSGQAELYSEAEQRLAEEFVKISRSGQVETSLDFAEMRAANPDKIFTTVDLCRYDSAVHALQSVRIHRILSSCGKTPGFLNYENIYLAQLEADASRLQCVMMMPKLGKTLDGFLFQRPREAVDVILRVAKILSDAEIAFQYEHRNLHPGSVLIERSMKTGEIDDVKLVNCELSRLAATQNGASQVLYTPLDHPGFYRLRLPVLAQMREVVKDPAGFVPATNVLWLRYLARVLYNRCPSNELKKAEAVLSSRWSLRKPPSSAVEAYHRLKQRMQS